MDKCDKPLARARNSKNNFGFSDVCYLPECFGFEHKRTTGSHFVYEHPNLVQEHNRNLTLQNINGRAKPYQVGQLLKAIDFMRHGK